MPDFERLDGFAAGVLAAGMSPAVAVAITDEDRTLTARTYGAADPDALWPIASIGKSFTAVIALQLAEEGLLDLHAPVSDYVPWLTIGSPSAPITLHHLLNHTAGVIETSDLAPASTYDVIALADVPTGFAPGEHRERSDYGYGLQIHADGFGHGGDMLGYVAYMRTDTTAGLGAVAFANGFGGAWRLGAGALAIAKGDEPPQRDAAQDEPLVDDGSCSEPWIACLGRYRSHNPWLPTFLIAAREGALVLGTDWVDGSWRAPLVPVDDGAFRVGEAPWLPERIRFDTVIDGRAQRAHYRGTSYYRAFTS